MVIEFQCQIDLKKIITLFILDVER